MPDLLARPGMAPGKNEDHDISGLKPLQPAPLARTAPTSIFSMRSGTLWLCELIELKIALNAANQLMQRTIFELGQMVVSSRTPEGIPHRCPVCGKMSAVEPSYPGGDSCCPSCGQLLWWFRDRLSHHVRIAPERITLSSSFAEDLGADSLDIVELVMELEEHFGVTVPDDEAEQIKTVEDAIRSIERHRQ